MKILLNNDTFLPYENAKKALESCYIKKGVAGFKYPFFRREVMENVGGKLIHHMQLRVIPI